MIILLGETLSGESIRRAKFSSLLKNSSLSSNKVSTDKVRIFSFFSKFMTVTLELLTIRLAKFSSLNEKFVTFARRKVSPNNFKSEVQEWSYEWFKSFRQILIGETLSGEIFVTFQKIRHFRPLKFCPIRYLVLNTENPYLVLNTDNPYFILK